MTKVTIISGFLGAGKTTLIRKLLEEVFPDEKKVLIENEYGEIGIDGSFLKDSGIQITEMNSGCICCTLVGDFTAALQKMIEEYHPDRIIIEPSGVGKLSDVAGAVERVKAYEDIEITEKIAVVDAKKAKLYMKNFGEFFKDQVHYASTIVLSRTQFMNEAQLAEVIALLRTENASAPLISTPWDQLRREAVLHALENSDVSALIPDEEEEECCCHHHHHDEDEDEEEHEHCHHHHHDEDEEEHEHCCHHHHDEDEDEEEHEHCHHHHHHEDEEEHEHCCHHHHDEDEEEEEHEHCHHHRHDEDEEEHEHCCCHHHEEGEEHHHHHHADEVFISWGRETVRKFSGEELQHILHTLAEEDSCGTVLRAKGIIAMTDGTWKQFDLVPGETEVRPSEPDYTGRICVIGADLKEDVLTGLFGL